MNPIKNTGNSASTHRTNSRSQSKINLNKSEQIENENPKFEAEKLDELKKRTSKNTTPENIEEKVTESSIENLYYQIEELKLTLENTKKEAEEIKLIAQRAVADGQNLARQHELEIQSSQKKLKKSVAGHILHVLNTLYLAFQYSPETDDEKILKYINTIKLSFEKSLEDLKVVGIEILIAHKDDAIDFNTMNIINTPQNPDNQDPKVMQVVSLGLRIDNQVVQPITVMV